MPFFISFQKGITSDLFPGITLPEPDYMTLTQNIKNNASKMNLQLTDFMLDKILQVCNYEY